MVLFVGLLCLCLSVGCTFTPPRIVYTDRLVPHAEQADERVVVGDSSATYTIEGLRVRVEPMSMAALNRLFPEDSARGKFSTNPYTYGDWVDPVKGYTPTRFTVFRVTVFNDIYAKVLLDPVEAVLMTDRGDVLHAYGIPSFSPHDSFERYYRALRGQSGNEFYRFDLRMGNVRSSAYLEDQRVFKGERYGGLIAFEPLDEEVRRARLVLRDFVLKFDASGQPLEKTDIAVNFDRSIDRRRMRAERPQK